MDLDGEITRLVSTHRVGWATCVFRGLTELGSLHTVGPVAIVVAVVLLRRRDPADAVLLLSMVIVAELAADLLKLSFGRSRPAVELALVHATGPALPSGHTTQATAFYGTLALVASRRLVARRLVLGARAGAVATAVLVGASRVYLGVHWASDVLAGWALGATLVLVAGRWALPWPSPVAVRSIADGPPGEGP